MGVGDLRLQRGLFGRVADVPVEARPERGDPHRGAVAETSALEQLGSQRPPAGRGRQQLGQQEVHAVAVPACRIGLEGEREIQREPVLLDVPVVVEHPLQRTSQGGVVGPVPDGLVRCATRPDLVVRLAGLPEQREPPLAERVPEREAFETAACGGGVRDNTGGGHGPILLPRARGRTPVFGLAATRRGLM